MAFEIKARYGTDEKFWSNIEKLQRIVFCFSKDTDITEANLQSHPMDDQSRAVDLAVLNQKNSDSECLNNKKILLKKIESILQNYLIKNNSENFGSIQVPNRQSWKNTSFEIKRGIKMIANPTLTTIGSQRKGSERKLVRILHVLTKIHKLIQTNSYRTKRELFYEDVNLFKTQKSLDDILDDIACLLQTPKVKLHVLTTSKGCISGNLRYKESDGSYVDCSESSQGILISNDVDSISYIQSEARFILVVEKSAVFQMLLDCNITELLHPCIMITGKGFPDVNTREMLRKLWDFLKIPILGVMDADPYGIEILSIYKYGSKAMSFDVEKLAVPEMRWLGLLPSDIQRLHFPKSAMIPITDHDRSKISKLLQRPYIQSNIQWQHQIQILLEKSFKAEIEGLNKISDDFLPSTYLPNKIKHGGWI